VAATWTLLTAAIGCNAETVNTIADLSSNKRTTAYIHSRPIMNAMYKLAIEQDKIFGLQQDCKEQYKVEPYGITILMPIIFPDDKQNPTRGAWNFRYQVHRCGESKFYNALFISYSDGTIYPNARATHPGSTNAAPLLVKDAMLSATAAAMSKAGLSVKDCKEIDVFDMRVTSKPGAVTDGVSGTTGAWDEIWTFRLCGQMADIQISFVPDPNGRGTAFSIQTANSATKGL